MVDVYIQILVQIITESLPISSSGHVALLERVLGLVPLSDMVEHAMHLPTACVLPLLFKRELIELYAAFKKAPQNIIVWGLLIGLADSITGLCYLLFKYYKPTWFPLSVGFGITALLLVSLRFIAPGSRTQLTYYEAALLGLIQGIALLPGISRFAATFVAGRLMGMNTRYALFTSFAVQWPLLLAAGSVGVGKLLYTYSESLFSYETALMLVTVVGSTVASYYIFKAVFALAEKNSVWLFGIYMIIPLLLALTI